MKSERDVLWLGPAFKVLKCSPSIDNTLKQAQVRKERTAKRHAKARKQS
jgi:hypothetical protein